MNKEMPIRGAAAAEIKSESYVVAKLMAKVQANHESSLDAASSDEERKDAFDTFAEAYKIEYNSM